MVGSGIDTSLRATTSPAVLPYWYLWSPLSDPNDQVSPYRPVPAHRADSMLLLFSCFLHLSSADEMLSGGSEFHILFTSSEKR